MEYLRVNSRHRAIYVKGEVALFHALVREYQVVYSPQTQRRVCALEGLRSVKSLTNKLGPDSQAEVNLLTGSANTFS